MASKTIEEYLKAARPEQLAELKKDGQDLQRNGVAVKPEYQSNAPKAKQARSTEPQINEPVTRQLENDQRGAEKIRQTQSQAQQPKDTAQEKAAPEKAREPER